MNPLLKNDDKCPKKDLAVEIKDGRDDKRMSDAQIRKEGFLFVFIMFVIMVIWISFLPTCDDEESKSVETIELEQTHAQFDKLASALPYFSTARDYTPEQLHLSLGANSSEIYITWSTLKAIEKGSSYVQFCKHSHLYGGCAKDAKIVHGIQYRREFQVDTEWSKLTNIEKREIITYRAKVEELEPYAVYIYRVVSEVDTISGLMTMHSKTYQFLAQEYDDPTRDVKLAFYGDLGLVNGQSIDRLIKDTDFGAHDLIIHNGDFAYDLNSHGGRYGDMFMRLIEPIAARVPYQTSVGNHEIAENFTHYDHRFTMINSGGHNVGEQNNFYYSFNVGPIHFIAFSTEFYYWLETTGMEPLARQYEWLKKDLELASSPEERAIRPWIIVFGHRPMYCSSRDRDDCTKDTDVLRKGLPFTGLYALEKLFFDHGVDVELYSHEHMYERFLPIYDGHVYLGNDSTKNHYHNPRAPVHIISGSAGCQERLDPFMNKSAPGSVKQISDYGFLRIEANRCEIQFEQFSTDWELVVDKFTIEKTRIQNFPVRTTTPDLDCTMDPLFQSCSRGWALESCSQVFKKRKDREYPASSSPSGWEMVKQYVF